MVDRKLADSMSTYWVNFVTTGDPNMKGLPRWESYDFEQEPFLEFAGAIRRGRHLFKNQLDFQERFQNRKTR
jgi:para-nitrobenzyl esterase